MTDYATPIDCETAVRLLWDYLDGRLSAMAKQEMDAHLAVCERCPPHFVFARSLQRALAASASPGISPDEEARIRERIRAALQRMANGVDDRDLDS
jgi:anti-sigma factor RsiW